MQMIPRPTGLWRRTPPAIFPPVLGLLGLGLAWRRAADGFGAPAAMAEAFLGGAIALYAFCLMAWMAKFLRGPKVLAGDLKVLPGRAGIAAMVLCLYLLAAVAVPYDPDLARVVLWTALAVHLAMLVVLIGVLATGPAEQRQVTPVWHLNFVGFILAGLSAPALGMTLFAAVILGVTTFVAAFIWAVSAERLLAGTPAPLRPMLAMHLTPAAVLGITAHNLGLAVVADLFAGIAALMLVALALRASWLIQAGFTPMWGAFTFPLAATTNLWLAIGGFWRWPGLAALLLATLTIPWIAQRILKLWAAGELAAKTNAAAI